MTREGTKRSGPRTSLAVHGVVGGILAGIVFALGEMLISVAQGGAFLGPLRLISTITLGTEALTPGFPLGRALIVGLLIHMVLSALFGVIFVYLLAATAPRVRAGQSVLFGAIYGLLLWIVNFLILARFFFPQFTEVNQFWSGFFAHTFLYGVPLGAYLASVTTLGRQMTGTREGRSERQEAA